MVTSRDQFKFQGPQSYLRNNWS